MLYCFLKSSTPDAKVHKAQRGSGIPACGTRVDTCALETEWADTIPTWAGDPCGKCFPVETDIDPDNSVFAKAATMKCPACGARPGSNCFYVSGPRRGASMTDRFHKARMVAAKEALDN